MFGRRKYEVLVPLTSDEPVRWPWGWAKCPHCNCGRRFEDDVCPDCAVKGLTYDWSGGNKNLTYEELQQIKNPSQFVHIDAGDTISWSCNYTVESEFLGRPAYFCRFNVKYRVKQSGLVDLAQPPEAMLIHIAREGHYDIGGN